MDTEVRGRWAWVEGVLALVDDYEYECYVVRADELEDDLDAESGDGWVWIATWGDGEGSGTMNGPVSPTLEDAREAAMAWMAAHPLGDAVADEETDTEETDETEDESVEASRKRAGAMWSKELDGTWPDGSDQYHFEADVQDGMLYVSPGTKDGYEFDGEWGFEADFSYVDDDGEDVEAIYEDSASWVDPEQAMDAAERWVTSQSATWLQQRVSARSRMAALAAQRKAKSSIGFLEPPSISQR